MSSRYKWSNNHSGWYERAEYTAEHRIERGQNLIRDSPRPDPMRANRRGLLLVRALEIV